MATWTPLQLDADQTFVDGWRRHGLDVDLASLTYPGQYHYVPEYLAARGWETVQRDVTDVLSALGPATPRGGTDDTTFVPEYVTATRL